jgi:hypothetical protein
MFKTVGDRAGFEKAIRYSMPDETKTDKLKAAIAENGERLKAVERDVEKLLDAFLSGSGKVSATVKKKIDDLEKTKALLEAQIKADMEKLKSLPDPETFKADVERTRLSLNHYFKSYSHFHEMRYEDKRALLQWLFPEAGRDEDGRPYGIFLGEIGRDGRFDVEINARLFTGITSPKEIEAFWAMRKGSEKYLKPARLVVSDEGQDEC